MKSKTKTNHSIYHDRDFIQAALQGYQQQLAEINQKIADLQGRMQPSAAVAAQPKKERRISPEGLKRIREAQQRRWAAHKAKSGKAGA